MALAIEYTISEVIPRCTTCRVLCLDAESPNEILVLHICCSCVVIPDDAEVAVWLPAIYLLLVPETANNRIRVTIAEK